MAERLARLLGADLVAVAECSGPGRMRVAAGCFDGLPLEDLDYENRFSPCREVMRTACALELPGGVQQRFPQDAMLRAEGIQSYAGVPLILPAGGVAGVLHAAWRRETGPVLTARALAAMQPFAARLAAGLAAQRGGAALASLARGSGGGPQTALRWLAGELQAASGARAVLIAGAVPGGAGHLQVLACCLDGAPQPAVEGGALPRELATRPPGALRAPLPELLAASSTAESGDVLALASRRSHTLRDRRGAPEGCFLLMSEAPLPPMAAGLEAAFAAQIQRELRRLSARRLRHQRRQAREQSERSASLVRLAGGISHAFDNLLAAMQSQTELALGHFGEAAGCHPAAAHVRRLEQEVRASAAFLGPLRDYAGTAGAQALCDLSTEAQAAAGMMGKAAAGLLQSDLSVAPLPLRGDAAALRRLVLYLLQNALEALPADAEGRATGSIRLSTARAAPSAFDRAAMLNGSHLPQGPCAALEVRDSGTGMSAEIRARIFDPFFSTQPGRHGLGLAAALGTLRRHGGAAAVESAVGKGSCFRLYFPLAEPAARGAAAARAAHPPAGPGQRRILVVDDEDTVCRAVAGLLRLKGCAVELADGHAAALEVLRRGAPLSGAVIDMNLPGRCGWETLAALRALQPGLPCVMMSGFAVSAAAAGYPDLSGVEVLAKPFCKEQLYRAVLR
ncbi:hybrid sensor histidine kinase/response regulator [Cribrihabitans neustonicus]|uniref:hybrid sensor histidine kinase/response regulator n=1 Tax=Cribrihabitans neustonicus TaxID=1429085 RepID=UPI003B5B9B3B